MAIEVTAEGTAIMAVMMALRVLGWEATAGGLDYAEIVEAIAWG